MPARSEFMREVRAYKPARASDETFHDFPYRKSAISLQHNSGIGILCCFWPDRELVFLRRFPND
jgi:hypothetical protein